MTGHDAGRQSGRDLEPLTKRRTEAPSDKTKKIEEGSETDAISPAATEDQAELLKDPRLSLTANTERAARLLMGLQESRGNAHVQRLLGSRTVQAKLTVHPPDDEYEKEADRVADRVTRAPQQQVQRQAEEEEEEVQTKAATGAVPDIQRQAEEEEEGVQTKPAEGGVRRQEMPEEEEVQTKTTGKSQAGEASDALEDRISAQKGGGQSLPDSVRTSLEPQFGRDLGGVRVHTGAEASDISRQLRAKAFTTGSDIFFGEGEYQPESDSGKRLIGHEITHVVQQGAASLDNRSATAADTGSHETEDGAVHRVQRKEAPGIEFTAEEVREALGGPAKPKFKLERGSKFKETLDGASLDSTLLKRVEDMARFAIENGLVTADITLNSGMRSPSDAHMLSTAYHIGQGMVPLRKLQALPGGADTDGNVWYKKEWETTRGKKKATTRQIMAKARANAKAKFPKQRQAAEGYPRGDPRREPNTFKGGVTLHATGRAIDATFCWDWSKGKKSQEKVMDPAKLERIKDKATKIKDEEKRENLLRTISEFEARGSYSAAAEETVAKFGLSRPILHARTSPEDWHYQLRGPKK